MSKHVKEGDMENAVVVRDGLVRILLSECFLVEPFYNSIIVAAHIYSGPFVVRDGKCCFVLNEEA